MTSANSKIPQNSKKPKISGKRFVNNCQQLVNSSTLVGPINHGSRTDDETEKSGEKKQVDKSVATEKAADQRLPVILETKAVLWTFVATLINGQSRGRRTTASNTTSKCAVAPVLRVYMS
ncbi:hypothetical protein K0M31_016648 [Melipona bicolor]|uniref:Uncharacterized protein n=1 Tax=Melipona bicolor TaxID=60889 RepID=A0AA40KES7_9HYME|nr:hypothetical protein K0M31_016648 [Melipona bicolor]